MLKVRVIPTLLWKSLGLVKGVRFDSWRRVGTIMPAVKVYNNREVDELALLDIGLPGMSGHELARRIRQTPEGEHVLLVAVTGYGQESDRRAAMDAGFDDHIVKPASLERIDAILERFEQNRARK